MAFKAILLCASALLVQSISGQCISYRPSCGCSPSLSSGYGSGLSSCYGSGLSSGYGSGLSSSSAALSSGGDFPVTSTGPISPSGIAINSQVDLAGNLDVCGTMPFLSAVQFETCLPTSGSGVVDYSCGCGSDVGITSVIGGSGGSCGCSCRG